MSYPHCTSPTLLFAQTQSASAEPAASADRDASPDDRDAEFVPDRGGTEQTSGEVLLIEAYAAIWLLVFGMIFLSMRKQKKLDQRISQLTADLEKAREKGD